MKKGKKVSWKRLDCQDELHRTMTYNKFTTLTPGEEEQEFDEVSTSIGGNCFLALNTAVKETYAKRKVNTKKNIDMLVKVRKSHVGGCAKNSPDENRQNTFLTMKFMSQLNPGAVKTFNLPPESQFLIWETCGCHCT